MKQGTLPALILSVLFMSATLAAPLKVNDLRVDFQKEATGVGEKPSLSWKLSSDERGKWQSEYHILAASTADLLTEEKADLWDSGRKKGAIKHLISWGGKPLKAGTKVFWKVKVWDAQKEESEWSEPSHFTSGGKKLLTKPGRISGFDSSSAELNELYAKSITQLEKRLATFPEKPGSGAEVQRSARALLYHFDTLPHLTEWIRMMDQSMTKEGFFPTHPGSKSYHSISSSSAVIANQAVWWMGGDSQLVKKRWTLFEKYMMAREDLDRGFKGQKWGKTADAEGVPAPFLDLCYLGLTTRMVRELAGPAQQPLNVIRFKDYAARIRKSFEKQYLTEAGALKVKSQTAHVLALRSAVLTPEQQKMVITSLMASLKKNGVQVGPIGAYFLPPVLTLTNHQDEAVRLLTKLSDDEKKAFLGNGVSEWLMSYLAGIDTAMHGFGQPLIAPRIPGGDSIKWVKAHYDSVAGRVSVHWQKQDDGSLKVDLTIPPGVIARVSLPATKKQTITEGGKTIKEIPGVEPAGRGDSVANFIAQSGTFSFLIK